MSGKVLLARPKDRSLEAFKAWILEFTRHLTGRDWEDGSITEEGWRELWEKFWAKADKASGQGEEEQK